MKFKAKVARFQRIRAPKDRKVKLFNAGMSPGAMFGHEVFGVTPQQLKKLRVEFAKASGVWAPGCVLDHVLAGEPNSIPC